MTHKTIHLLYSPTMSCNLSCNYCYLGKKTTEASLKEDSNRALATLQYTLNKLSEEEIVAFNVSLHGGEVTTLPIAVLEDLFKTINNYYLKNYDLISSLGHKKINPHIKTNLYKFSSLYDLFDKYKVSISASIDLPLRLHGKHRITLGGKSWLDKTIDNLKLLAKYPHNKKISTTISQEHIENIDEFIADIWYIHNEIGFDMNNFNLMFAFPSNLNNENKSNYTLTPTTEKQQIELYNRLNQEFKNTELEEGLLRNWFDEFKPTYCTNSINCGEKFFLLQSDGSIYSCVRGQGLEDFYYGNVFENKFSEIMQCGFNKIKNIHTKNGMSKDCKNCSDLSICNTGCPIVKNNTNNDKSYTCQLQKTMYNDFPLTYSKKNDDDQKSYTLFYLQQNHPQLAINEEHIGKPTVVLSNDFYEEKNTLLEIIKQDNKLLNIFNNKLFYIELENELFFIEPQIFKNSSTQFIIEENEIFKVHFPKTLISDLCEEPLRNTIYLQMLRDTPVIYGDEQRTKQEHIFNYQIYSPSLENSDKFDDKYMIDLMPLLKMHKKLFKRGILNNLFFTTSYLRDYHYSKHKNNAFYHLQTINLPFQNLEFYFLPKGF